MKASTLGKKYFLINSRFYLLLLITSTLLTLLRSSIVDLLLDKANMTDDFEYFSLIGRGGSCTPSAVTPEREIIKRSPSQEKRIVMSDNGKEAVTRVHSHGKDSTGLSDGSRDEIRPRTNSMPSKNHLLRVRNFQTSGKKFENRGDTVKTSHCSLVSSDNSSEGHSDSEDLVARSEESESTNTHRILLLGAEGVGKTALTQQFLTSDDITGADYLGKHWSPHRPGSDCETKVQTRRTT